MHFTAGQSKATNASSHDEASRSFTRAMSSTHPLTHPLPEQGLLSSQEGLLQRTCTCGSTPGVDGECAECRNTRLQRPALNYAKLETEAPTVRETLSSPGQPLDAATRAYMEPRIGHDFSKVRVHTDAKAAESAQAVHAAAYTIGPDIAFGAEQYTPETSEGRRLLAHELTHVVQQERGAVQGHAGFRQSEDIYEQEADVVARSVLSEQHGAALENTRVGSSSDVAEAEPTAPLTVQAAPIAIQRQRDIKNFEPELIESTAESLQQTSDRTRQANEAILKHVTDYAFFTIQMGHRLGFAKFRAWYTGYEKSKERANAGTVKSLFDYVFKKGLNFIFPGGEAFVGAVKQVAEFAWEQGTAALKPAGAGDVEQFLNALQSSEEEAITGLLDVPKNFLNNNPDVVAQARNELVGQWLDPDVRWTSPELPPSVKNILQQAGVGEPGTATATQFAERWLTTHINGIYVRDPGLRQIADIPTIGVFAEIDALRQMDAVGNRERIYELDRTLTPFLQAMVDINKHQDYWLKLKLGISAAQASRIVESRRAQGPFSSTDELVSRQLIPQDVYERIKPYVVARQA
jgi:Zn-dependent peptidase ImmA (M78 family)